MQACGVFGGVGGGQRVAGSAGAGADGAPLVDGDFDVQVDARLGAVQPCVIAVVVVVQVMIDLRLQRQGRVGLRLGLGQLCLALCALGQGHQHGGQAVITLCRALAGLVQLGG
ncbi:hypothetical protein D9M73_172630 [compost metagenome]